MIKISYTLKTLDLENEWKRQKVKKYFNPSSNISISQNILI